MTPQTAQQANATSIQSQLAADPQIFPSTAEVQTLQDELNAKKNYVAPAWYDPIGSAGIVLIILVAAIVVGVGAFIAGGENGKEVSEARPVWAETGVGTPDDDNERSHKH
jgi:hypothetical protein